MNIEQARRRVRLRDLETLSAVVQAGGMNKAARALHLTQPAISKSIRALETALGVPLLERSARGVVPTVFGEALARRSIAVFDDLQGALRELAWLADPDSGEVRLACMETLHAGLVGAVVERVTRKHPRMRLVLESGQAGDLIDIFLRQRLVEFVVARPLALPLPDEVQGEALFHDRMRVVVGVRHPLARRRRIGLADLVEEHWILSRNEVSIGSPIVEAFSAAGLEMPDRVVITGSLNTRYHLLDSGRFVAVLPHSLLPYGMRPGLKLLPIEFDPWRVPTMILTLRGRTVGPAAQRFLQTLRESARTLSR